MEKEKLAQYRDLQKEIKSLEERIFNLKRQKQILIDSVKGSNPDYPYQPVTISIKGIPYNQKQIERLELILSRRLRRTTKLKLEIEEFISEINDSRTRMIFEQRYLLGWSWRKISMECGSRDESYARKLHDRYFVEIRWD